MVRRSGRRPGNPDTREAILAAARESFADRGYDGASIRAIAAAAGVDPALVHHYFGTKDQLFAATVNFPMLPREVLGQVLADGPDAVGERLVRTFLRVWDSPAGAAGVALLRTAVHHDWGARLLREFLTTQILRRVMATLEADPAESALRAALVASQVAGLALTRYVLRIEPLASAPPDVVVAAVAPTIQRYVTGDVTGAGGSGGTAPDAASGPDRRGR